ncbi:MAG: beta-galactosidase [Cutibacterium sp.]|nr:beta-galactosidase [Cutibacterium sp.]MDO4411579.1 beta-galactosidase [Cutibacterium sp.]
MTSALGTAALLITSSLCSPGTQPAMAASPDSDVVVPTQPATIIGDGKPHKVTFDKHSFMIDGERLNVYAGEFHYWRLPSPDAWRDVMQKIKASGFNAVSLYFFWGLHQTEEGGEFDFSGIKDIDKLLTIAEEEGLFVIARPGPYINAEISMGGLPAWMSNKGYKSLRSVENLAPAKEWLNAFNAIAKKHLVTNGGGSILLYQVENELIDQTPLQEDYLKALTKVVRDDGIDVPLFHNDWGMGGRFKDTEKFGTDFYTSDVYPLGFNCSQVRKQLPDNEQQFRKFAPDTPYMIAESQGGAFTPWGASFSPEKCAEFTDSQFTRQWSMTNMANGVTAFSYYMSHGGTNWGWTGAPASGYTSYDYGAALNEARAITPKLAAQKEAGYLQRAFPALTEMDPAGAPTVAEQSGDSVKGYQRIKAGDGTDAERFLAFRLSDSNSTKDTSFTTSLWLDSQDTGIAAPVVVEDDDAQIAYSGKWTKESDPSASGGTIHTATTKGASATFKFNGTGIRYLSASSTDFGKVQVQVDDRPAQVVNAWTSSNQNKPSQVVLADVQNLDPGEHTITVTALGEKADPSGGTTVSVDAFQVTKAPDSRTAGGEEHKVGWSRIPQTKGAKLHLHGRDAIALTANFDIAGNRVGYTTAQLFAAPQPSANGVVQYLMGVEGDPAEIVIRAKSEPSIVAPEGVTKSWNAEKGELLLSWTTKAQPQDIVVNGDGQPLTLRAISRDYAANVWQVYDGNRPVTVEGADLVRGAKYDGRTLHLNGSMSKPATLRVVADGMDSWTWNGTATSGAVPGPKQVEAPELEWHTTTGAPEANPKFDVGGWKIADSTRADNSRQGPGPHQGVVLDSNHYGFFEGDVWYRASYTAAGSKITLQGNGGSGVPAHGRNPAFGQVWANGKYVGAFAADGSSQSLTLPVSAGDQVELAVLVHNLGQNLDWNDDGLSRQNRGLYDADLNSSGAVTWRIQGAGDPTGNADLARTMYNNGGLYGERAGWYLPGYPISDWAEASSFAPTEAGLNWYASDFTLDVPEGQDQAYEVQITPNGGIPNDHSQVTIFVNGWNTGVYIGDIGPQTKFTIPAQFLNLRGTNRLTVAVASKTAGAGPKGIDVVPTTATTGSVIGAQNEAPSYPKRSIEGKVSSSQVDPGAEVRAESTIASPHLIRGDRLGSGELVRIEYLWGDGSQPTSTPTHAYSAAGTYDVTAVARDSVSGQKLAQAVIGRVTVGGTSSEPSSPTPSSPVSSQTPSSPVSSPTAEQTTQGAQRPPSSPDTNPSKVVPTSLPRTGA